MIKTITETCWCSQSVRSEKTFFLSVELLFFLFLSVGFALVLTSLYHLITERRIFKVYGEEVLYVKTNKKLFLNFKWKYFVVINWNIKVILALEKMVKKITVCLLFTIFFNFNLQQEIFFVIIKDFFKWISTEIFNIIKNLHLILKYCFHLEKLFQCQEANKKKF